MRFRCGALGRIGESTMAKEKKRSVWEGRRDGTGGEQGLRIEIHVS